MGIYNMQLDTAVCSFPPSLLPDTIEQLETPSQAPVALTPYGLKKQKKKGKKFLEAGNHKTLFFSFLCFGKSLNLILSFLPPRVGRSCGPIVWGPGL